MSISKRNLLFSFATLALSLAALPFTAYAGGDCCAPQKTQPAAMSCCKDKAECCKNKAACCKDKSVASCCKDKAVCCQKNEACCKGDAKRASCCATKASCCADKKKATANAKPMACCAAKSTIKPKAGATPAPAHKH